MSQTIKRTDLKLLSILAWLAIAWAGLYVLGPDGFLVAVLGTATVGAIIRTIRRNRIKKLLGRIADTDDRCVRFDGSLVQANAARAIGESEGWTAEEIPHENLNMQSVRFRQTEGASSARSLVDAFFQAGLIQNVDA